MTRDMNRRVGITLLLILALSVLAAGCGGEADAQDGPQPATERPRNVRVLTLTAAPLVEYLELSGPAAPLRGAVLSAEEGGRVESIDLDKGSRALRGQVLLTLDRRLLASERDAADAARDLAAFNATRMKQLLDENAVSAIDYERARTELRQAAATAAAAALRHERARITAPFDGVVVDRYVELGELLAPGAPVSRILDPYVLKLECDATEQDIVWISEGEEAVVRFSGLDRDLPGRVHWVGFEADPLTGKFPVEIRVENADLALRPGVMGRARVLKTEHADVISIPRDAILERNGGSAVFVEKSGRVSLRSLTLGPDQGLMVVVPRGLEAGERVVVRGQRDLADGAAVTVTEESRRPDGGLPSDPDLSARGGDAR